VRLKVESEERNMVLTILRTTGVVTLIEEGHGEKLGLKMAGLRIF